MSPYGGYGSREEGAYGGDEERGTWGGSGYQGSGHGGNQGGSHGYPGGRQARAPRGYQRSDERIREDICDTVIRMGIDAGDVDIMVEHCEVTLTGTVDNRHDKRRLEDLAESVSGVKHVHNQLRVEEQQRRQSKSTSGETQNQTAGYGGTSANAGKNATQHNAAAPTTSSADAPRAQVVSATCARVRLSFVDQAGGCPASSSGIS